MKALRIRIVGGSLAGLFAGVLLQRDGHDVRLYERSSRGLANRGAGLVVQAEVSQILKLIGREHVARLGVVAQERIFLDRAGRVAERISTQQTQASWDAIYKAVLSQFGSEHYVLGKGVEHLRDAAGGASITFQDGSTEDADLVIGADGLGSVVRKEINPSGSTNSFAGYAAWRGLIDEAAIAVKAEILLERFTFHLAQGIQVLGYLVPGVNGELLPGQRRYNWVWYRRIPATRLSDEFTDRSGRVHPFSLPRGGLSDDRLSLLRQEAQNVLPPQLALAVAAENQPSIQGIFDYEAPRMAGQSTALIGDAAFVVRPHTAMGVSKAAGDVMALRRHLSAEENLPRALLAYEQERRPVGAAIAAYGRRLGETAL
ncbi:FAD-dependent monooxygenase [Bradyrhizobium ganzhouense]|uniref:FAD binding domain-containing protein n=1 Tax=Bradyrhizobium ganzhouense TaxID=1179767 RepID=UPI003CF91375